MIDQNKAAEIISILKKVSYPDPFCRLIACQSAFETKNFTSHEFITDNNGFGYKFVKGAKYQIGAGNVSSEKVDHYAKYESLEKSVLEIVAWIGRRQKEGKIKIDLSLYQTPYQWAFDLKKCGYYGGTVENYTFGIDKYFATLK